MGAELRISGAPENRFAVGNAPVIPPERYFDREFFELEKDRLWRRTWQMACRLEEIPEVNDFVEYEICDQSILIVRQKDETIKAFLNACRHRATQLAKGVGRFPGGKIVCPFHGWQWDADGSSSLIYGKAGFKPDCMSDADLRLAECRVEIWGGSVWINIDRDAQPLMEQLQPIASRLDAVGVSNMRTKWWKETILNANWKMALEAFMESYHVMQTHPQITLGMGHDYPADFLKITPYENGHGAQEFKDIDAAYPSVEASLMGSIVVSDGQDAMFLDRDRHVLEGMQRTIQPGDNIREKVAEAFRTHNHNAGIAMPDGVENESFWWGAVAFVYPNYFMLPQYGNALCYRSRPYNDDPEWCRFEVWSLTSYPESYPRSRVKLKGRYDITDEENWGLIPRQDFSNIERQQRGVHAAGFPGMRLAEEWEAIIANMHRELDRRMARA